MTNRLSLASIEDNLITSKKPLRVKTSKKPYHSDASPYIWHQRMAHPDEEAIYHLETAIDGISVTQPSRNQYKNCEICNISTSNKQISRRPIYIGNNPFETIHWDLIHMNRGYNADKYVSHAYCPVTKYHLGATIPSKTTIPRTIKSFIQYIRNQYHIRPKKVHLDSDTNVGIWFDHLCEDEGLEKEESPPSQPEQNPFSEISGKLIIKKSRILILDSNLPEYLWPEAVYAAIYILNRTPIRQLGWITPYEALYSRLKDDQKPGYMKPKLDLLNLRVYGYKTYIRILNIP